MEVAKRKVLFITGTRADFGKVKPLMWHVEGSTDFQCYIFATGMHMLPRYDFTVDEIAKAGFKNIHSYSNQADSPSPQMDLVLANTIQGLGSYVRELNPDLVVVHGDRVEALAGAIVGALNNVLVAHVEGGEISGTVDELIRHAVSKLSHIHFVSNDEARRRLVQMGEDRSSIFVIGSPDIDVMLSDSLPSLDEVKRRYEISFAEYGIFIYHPVTTELHKLERNIETVVGALRASAWNFVVIYPNNDHGSELVLKAILPLREEPGFRLLASMRFEYFLTLLKYAKAIVGNSSAGIREAPVYGVATVNIGSRQMNRYHYSSITNVAEDRGTILNALCNLPASVAPSLHFGTGNSAEGFMAALHDPLLWQTSRQKYFQDLDSAATPLAPNISISS